MDQHPARPTARHIAKNMDPWPTKPSAICRSWFHIQSVDDDMELNGPLFLETASAAIADYFAQRLPKRC